MTILEIESKCKVQMRFRFQNWSLSTWKSIIGLIDSVMNLNLNGQWIKLSEKINIGKFEVGLKPILWNVCGIQTMN